MIKIKIIKKHKNDILLSIALLFFSFLINYLAFHAYNLYYIDANTNFSHKSISFSILSDKEKTNLISRNILCPDNITDKISFYKSYSKISPSLYGVIRTNHSLNIISGNDFTKSDLLTGNSHLALAGKDAGKINDIENIRLNNNVYKIKGIFEDNKKPSNNFTIYISESSDEILCDDLFILDGKKSKDIEAAFELISDSLSQNGYLAKRIVLDKINPSNFIHCQTPLVVIYFFTILILIFLNFIMSVFWMFSNQREIAVLRLVGRKSSGKILKRYIIYTLISNIIGTLISFILYRDTELFWVCIISILIMELLELVSLLLGLAYFKAKDAKYLLEIDYE